LTFHFFLSADAAFATDCPVRPPLALVLCRERVSLRSARAKLSAWQPTPAETKP
jgi:hypothetical protein